MQVTQNDRGFSALQSAVTDELPDNGTVLLLDPSLVVLINLGIVSLTGKQNR